MSKAGLGYISPVSSGEFNEQLCTLANSGHFRQYFVLFGASMVRFCPVNVTFSVGRREFTISGWGSVRDVAVYGIQEPMLYVRIVEANMDFQPILIEEVEDNPPGPEEEDIGLNNGSNDPIPNEDDLPEDDPSEDEPLTPEPEDLRRQGVTRGRDDEEEEKSGLDFPELKKRRVTELLSETEESWSPKYPPQLPGRRWADEGPSDCRAEVWEEWWNVKLEKEFEECKMRGEMRPIKPIERENSAGKEVEGSESEEGEDRYKTNYIEWEAKEVIDLVSSSSESG